MIDTKHFGDNYFNWQDNEEKDLIDLLEEMKFNFSFVMNENDVAGVHTKTKEYGFPGKIAPFMENQWTYFYHQLKIHFYFKSENDKIRAILLK